MLFSLPNNSCRNQKQLGSSGICTFTITLGALAPIGSMAGPKVEDRCVESRAGTKQQCIHTCSGGSTSFGRRRGNAVHITFLAV